MQGGVEDNGDDVVRHCRKCDKDVFNLSNMTRDEAEELIVATAGNLCARYYQRADGSIMTSDCSVGVTRLRRRKLFAAGVLAVAAGAGALTYELARAEREHTMGAVAYPEVSTVPVAQPHDPPPVVTPPPVLTPPVLMPVVQGGIGFRELPVDQIKMPEPPKPAVAKPTVKRPR